MNTKMTNVYWGDNFSSDINHMKVRAINYHTSDRSSSISILNEVTFWNNSPHFDDFCCSNILDNTPHFDSI